jgi:hypothetical protein
MAFRHMAVLNAPRHFARRRQFSLAAKVFCPDFFAGDFFALLGIGNDGVRLSFSRKKFALDCKGGALSPEHESGTSGTVSGCFHCREAQAKLNSLSPDRTGLFFAFFHFFL